MRRAWVVPLAGLIGLGLALAGHGQGAAQKGPPPSPYTGTWKISVLDNGQELAVWLVYLEPGGKKPAEVLWGLTTRQNDFKTSVPKLIRADATGLRLSLRTGERDYLISALPPLKATPATKTAKAVPERMRGTVTVGSHIGPIQLERTDERQFARDKGVVPMEGAKELEAAVSLSPLSARSSAIQGLVKLYAGKPIALIASQVGVTHLVSNNAAPEDYKPFFAPFHREATLYGREMRLAAHLALGRTLLGGPKTKEMALDQVREAVKLIKDKEDPQPVQLYSYVLLVSALELLKKPDDVKALVPRVKALVEAGHKAAAPEAGAGVARDMARMLLSCPAPAVADLGLEQARKSLDLLGDKAPAWKRLAAQRLLQAALFSRGKKEEAEKIAALADRTEEELDRDYLKSHVPFKVEPHPGRKGQGRRTVLFEMFTNADVLVSAATDVAFDALRQAYKPADVIAVQYHRAVAAPDPLAAPAVDARVTFYGEVHAGNVPSLLIDGKATEALGGHRPQAQRRYETLRSRIDKALEAPELATLKLEATRKGDEVEVKADVSDLARAGDRVRLYLLLVEGVIRYEGGNGQRLHHNVVRAMITPEEGVKLDRKALSHSAKIDLVRLRRNLLGYLADLAKKDIYPPDRPVDLNNLKVVAIVQDNSSHQVFQAAVADVRGAK